MIIQVSNKNKYFEIDDADFDMISKYRWTINSRGYIITSIKGIPLFLHRMLLNLVAGDGKIIDHADGDTCNNKRGNLRLCTPSQNNMNSRRSSSTKSGFRGVFKSGHKWRATIRYEGRLYLGSYETSLEAAKAYDKSASKLHGKFARLNFDENSENHFSKDLTSPFNFYKPCYSSEFYGVSFAKRESKWRARVRNKYIRLFKTEQEAALAVDSYILKNNLDKSKLNFPVEELLETI